MIKSLNMTNFRRHADLELRFDDDRQLILIAGGNGVGKTTILEGIQFALWGEGRHGRRGLDSLMRRGAELEGMSVEMSFTVGEDVYRVHRRRDGKSSTAVLYVNETPLAEGPIAVTEEITALMGMDSAGFRLAVVAQQKDLDGLASLRPADRAQMITRLLRLDAITSAKSEASSLFRKERDLAVALRGDDPEQMDADVQEAEQQLGAARSELKKAQEALLVLDAELAATADVEAAWQQATQAAARLDGAVKELEASASQQRSELAGLAVPEAPSALDFDPDLTGSELADVERRIATAEAAVQAAAQRQAVYSEMERAVRQADSVRESLQQPEPDLAHLESQEQSARQSAENAEATARELVTEVGRAEAELAQAQRRLRQSESQEAVCESCGQEVTAEHREGQVHAARNSLGEAQQQLAAAQDTARQAREEAAARATEAGAAGAALREGRALAADLQRAREDLAELERRIRAYEGQLERLPDIAVDVDSLYAEKAVLLARMATAREHSAAEKSRLAALARRDSLRDSLEAITTTLSARRIEHDAAQPGAALEARYAERKRTAAAREDEAGLLAYWTTQAAVAEERKQAAEKRRAAAASRLAEQAAHQQQAVSAAAAGRLLADVADRMATQIRPGLEGAIGSILSSMSGGRFGSVKVTQEYDILVHDDGEYRSLSQLSGGEVDLVALATRLALAQVVSDRHGAGGAGFLVLDECFGSQDPQRRSAILEALRNLKDMYSQIFLISHVENIEDAADVVVTVRTDDSREETEVLVS